VAAAAACLLTGGVGGFLTGHATAGHGDGPDRVAAANDHGPRPGSGSGHTVGPLPGKALPPAFDDAGEGHDSFERGGE
jgi:hypothetical protein